MGGFVFVFFLGGGGGGGGVVSSQIDGSEIKRLVAYASCTLSKTEQTYSQLDKEVLALIFNSKIIFMGVVLHCTLTISLYRAY